MRKPRKLTLSFLYQSKHGEPAVGFILNQFKQYKSFNSRFILYCLAAVFLPLIIGAVWYIMPLNFPFQLTGKGYIPDLMWAFSFTSALLLIWNGRINVMWLAVLLILFPLFEFLQAKHVIAGTGDIFDVVCYYTAAFSSSLLYKTSFKPLLYEHSI